MIRPKGAARTIASPDFGWWRVYAVAHSARERPLFILLSHWWNSKSAAGQRLEARRFLADDVSTLRGADSVD